MIFLDYILYPFKKLNCEDGFIKRSMEIIGYLSYNARAMPLMIDPGRRDLNLIYPCSLH